MTQDAQRASSTRRFDSDGRGVDVERAGRLWRLCSNEHVVETRDLSEGIEQLLGKGSGNLRLVLRILEWEATAPSSAARET